jgi:hypothetical protein
MVPAVMYCAQSKLFWSPFVHNLTAVYVRKRRLLFQDQNGSEASDFKVRRARRGLKSVASLPF